MCFDDACKSQCDIEGSVELHLQVDKDLAGSRLGHVEINDLGRDLAGFVVDTCLVGAW